MSASPPSVSYATTTQANQSGSPRDAKYFPAPAILKAMVFGMAGAGKYFASLGLPDWFAWVVVAYETLGGLALIFGVYTRWVAVFLGVHLLFAAYLGHVGNGWMFTAKGGGYEYPLFWGIVCFALAVVGDGAFALKMRRVGSTPSA